MSFLQKFREFIFHPTQSRTMALLVVLVLVSVVSLTVIVAQQQQTLKQRAAGTYDIYPCDRGLKCDDNASDKAGYFKCQKAGYYYLSPTYCETVNETYATVIDDTADIYLYNPDGSYQYGPDNYDPTCKLVDRRERTDYVTYPSCGPSATTPSPTPTPTPSNNCYVFDPGAGTNTCSTTAYTRDCAITGTGYSGNECCPNKYGAGTTCKRTEAYTQEGLLIPASLSCCLPNDTPPADTCTANGGSCIPTGPCVPPAVQNTTYSCGNNPNGSVCCTTSAINQYILSGHVFVDANKNGALDNGEQDYANAINLILSGGTVPDETITTSYWARLRPAGNYNLLLTIPSGYEATTPTSISVSSLSSDRMDLNFGIASSSPVCLLKSKGDADCDGKIDILDFNIWKREFQGITATQASDFNNSYSITLDDFYLWKIGFMDKDLPH